MMISALLPSFCCCYAPADFCFLALVQPLFDMFVAAMRGASFNASTPLYVASGLLTYLSQDGETIRSAFAAADRPRHYSAFRG